MLPEKLIYRTWHWDWPWELTSFAAWYEHYWPCYGTGGKYGWRFCGIVCEYHWAWKTHEIVRYPEDNWML